MTFHLHYSATPACEMLTAMTVVCAMASWITDSRLQTDVCLAPDLPVQRTGM